MTDDEAAAIKERYREATNAFDLREMSVTETLVTEDIPALLAERAALLAEVEQWRAIGRQYIIGELTSWVAGDGVDVREQARALLEGKTAMRDDKTRPHMDVQFTPYGKQLLIEVYARAVMAHLMRDGEYRVTDNGNGTYTHEWMAAPCEDDQH